jgi:hypothetical protein
MRPARIIAAVLLTAAAAATGSYAAYTSNHPAAAASPTTTTGTAAPATTAPTTTMTTPGPSHAACTTQAILPLLKHKLDNPSGELAIVAADIQRCRNGYAHVFAISRPNPPGHPRYDHEQLFLRDVNGAWQSVAEGTGIACSDADITAAMLRACRALDYPTHTTAATTPRISKPQVVANRLVDAWMRGDRVAARKLASRTVSDRLFSESRPAQTPAALPCRLADLTVYVCSYPLAERAELTIIVQGGASAGYGVSGVEFGD